MYIAFRTSSMHIKLQYLNSDFTCVLLRFLTTCSYFLHQAFLIAHKMNFQGSYYLLLKYSYRKAFHHLPLPTSTSKNIDYFLAFIHRRIPTPADVSTLLRHLRPLIPAGINHRITISQHFYGWEASLEII